MLQKILIFLCIITQVFSSTCNPQYGISCKKLTALSTDNQSTSNTNTYFNFNASDMDSLVERDDWDGIILQIEHPRFGIQDMIFYDYSDGGSVGDSHGRLNNIPEGTPGNFDEGNFILGEKITLVDIPENCNGANRQPGYEYKCRCKIGFYENQNQQCVAYSGSRSNCQQIQNNYFIHINQGAQGGDMNVQGGKKGPVTSDAYLFDGKSYLDIGTQNMGSNVSVSFWANFYDFKYPASERAYQRIFQISLNSIYGQYDLLITQYSNEQQMYALIYNNNNSNDYNSVRFNQSTFNFHEFNHFLFLFDGVTQGGVIFYLNGQLQTPLIENTSIQGPGINTYTATYSFIGRGVPGNINEIFYGVLDELVFYNYVLSNEQIQCMYDQCQVQCVTCDFSANNCTQCRGDRINLPTCDCPVGKYEIQAENCEDCPYEGCSTCNSSECLSCIGDQGQIYSRISDASVNLNSCICPPGYFSDTQVQDSCLECAFKCDECITQDTNCTKCVSSRDLSLQCDCPVGFYDDEINFECQVCESGCQECDKDKCINCKANQINHNLGVDKTCDCINVTDHYIGHSFSDYCTTCTLAVIQPVLSKDYLKINIQFVDEITILTDIDVDIYSQQLCKEILNNQTILKVGNEPKCKLDSLNYIIKIKLGTNPTIVENDDIIFKQDKIQRVVCDDSIYIDTFEEIKLQYHQDSLPPSVKFTYIGDQISLCQDIQIQITKIQNDGKRGISNIEWILVDPQPNSVQVQSIQIILQNANDNNQQFLNIPALTLEEFTSYFIQVKIENFVGKDSIQSIEFSTLSKNGIVSSVIQTKPFLFQNFKQNEIQCIAKLLDCSNGYYEEIQEQLQFTWYDITDSNNQIEVQQSQQMPGINTLILEKYTQEAGKTYNIKLNIKVINQPIENNILLEYSMNTNNLMSYIKGGNRLQAYAKQLDIEGIGYDPDEPPDMQLQGIQNSWSCIDMGLQQPCQTIEGNLITYNSTNQLTYQPKLFEPYTTLFFTYTVSKSQKKSQDGITIIVIVETDLPLLVVNVPESFQTQKINKNDDIQISIDFEGNPDDVFFSLVFLYKFDVVATKSFEYTQFAFKIWDIFDNFENDESELLLRVSLYNPNYFMPSQSNFNIRINFQPQVGSLTITPSTGISLDTQFSIKLEGFRDEDLPLSYKYQYYFSQEEYQQEVKNGDKQVLNFKNTLIDFTNQNEISSILPKGNYNEDNNQFELVFMVSVSDSLGAIYNITEIIQVQENLDLQFNEQLDSIQNQFDQLENQKVEEQIYILNILASEITRLGVQNCLNNCSGNGKCDQIEQQCICEQNYILQDCSQNKDQIQCVDLMKGIYKKLQDLLEKAETQSIKDQMLKSINMILQNKDFSLALQSQDILDNFDQQNIIIEKQEQLLDNIIESGLMYQGDNLITIKYQQITEILGKCIVNIDKSIKNSEQNSDSKRVLSNDQQQNINQQVLHLSEKSSSIIQKAILPNSDSIEYSGQQLALNIQKQTNKKMEQTYFSGDEQYLTSNLKKQQISQQNYNENNDQNEDENDNQIYQSIFYSYQQNPYIQENNYPYPDQNNILNDLNIQKQVENNNNNEEDNQIENSDIIIKKPVTMVYDIEQENEKNVCIQKNKNSQNWLSENCQSKEQENENGGKSINCECQTLEPTTVVNDINNLFSDSLADEVYSDQGIQKLLKFQFWKSAMFYLILCKTLILVWCIYKGFQIDKKEFCKIQSQKEEKINENDFVLENGIVQLNVDNNEKQNQQQKQDIQNQEIKEKQQVQKNKEIQDNKQFEQINIENNKLSKSDQTQIQEFPVIKKKRRGTVQTRKNSNDINRVTRSKQFTIQLSSKDQNNNEQQLKKNINDLEENNQDLIQDEIKLDKKQQNFMQLQTDIQIQEQQDQQDLVSSENGDDNNLKNEKETENDCSSLRDQNASPDIFIMKNSDKNQRQKNVFQFQNSENQNQNNDQENQQQQENKKQKKDLDSQKKLRSISEGIIKFHEFFKIFYVNDEKISRPVRFCIYYIKIAMIIAISALFSQNLNQYQSIYLTILTTLVIGIPIFLIQQLYSSKHKALKILSVIILILLLCLLVFTIIVTAAIMGVENSNTWIFAYSSSFITDFFAVIPIKTSILMYILKQGIITGKYQKFIKPQDHKEILEFLQSDIHER